MHVHCDIYTNVHMYTHICIYTHNHFLSHNNRLFIPSIPFILHYKNCEPGHHLFSISNFFKTQFVFYKFTLCF